MKLITYDKRYAADFQRINLAWIENYFRVERKDVEHTSEPEKNIIEPGGQIFFVLEDEKVVGTCAVLKEENGVYEIAKMGVDRTSQGKGYGDVLMQACVDWCKNVGAREILIFSNTVLSPAISLYKKFGFETVKLGPHPDYERCNIEMRLKL